MTRDISNTTKKIDLAQTQNVDVSDHLKQLLFLMSSEAPPPNVVDTKQFFGHIRVFLMLFRTIWWHPFRNQTKIERFLFFISNQSENHEIRRQADKIAKIRGYGEFGKKKKKSFNFSPISEWMPPNCLKEHQEHTYMSKKKFHSPG